MDNSITNEFYVARLYNLLIEDGLKIGKEEISSENMIFSSVPEEYEAFKLINEDEFRRTFKILSKDIDK
jgi:hypothetical protein